MERALPTEANKLRIMNSMSVTFKDRRVWIQTNKTTFTIISDKYKHLCSYEGDVVSSFLIILSPPPLSVNALTCVSIV